MDNIWEEIIDDWYIKMKFLIISSSKDKAGINIFNNLIENYEFDKVNCNLNEHRLYKYGNFFLVMISEDTIYSENIDSRVSEALYESQIFDRDTDKGFAESAFDFVVFATRHQSKEKKPCLTCHTPGNWGKAMYGGKDKTMAINPASLLREFYLDLKGRNTLEGYEVSLECTHHGPELTTPTVFVEIGSCEEEWDNPEAGKILADSIIEVCGNVEKYSYFVRKAIVGFGGPHYCNNFNKILERTEYAISHVCPKYMLEHLDSDVVREAISKTLEQDVTIVLDWKGLGNEKERLKKIFEELDIEPKRVKDFI